MQKLMTMKTAPLWAGQGAVSFLTATVIHEEEGKFLLRTAEGSVFWARRSRGCLVQPAADDLALAADAGPEGVFILDILAGQDGPLTLSVSDDLVLEAKDKTVKLAGRHVALAPDEAATVEAPLVQIKGDLGRLTFRSLDVLSKLVSLSAQAGTTILERLDMTAGRVVQRLKNCFRRVEGLDETRAERLSWQGEGGVDVRGGRFSVAVKKEVKIDGRSVHIG